MSDGADQAVAPDEPHPLREVREEATGRLRVDRTLRPRNGSRDDRGGDDEARRVEPESRGRAEPRDEDAPERPADEDRALLDCAADPARALHPHGRELDEVRKERLSCGGARRVQECPQEHERHELPELDPDGGVEQRDCCDCRGARQVGDHARRTKAEAVHDDAAEERGKDGRHEVEEDREGGEGCASRRDEDEPRDRELRHGVADERDRVRDVERVEKTSSHASSGYAVTRIRRAVNAIVYVSDALRVDHLGCYGARFVNTRTIDELAAGGLRFDQAISAAPWTAPSMTSMVTGLYPHHHGYLHWDAELAAGTETLFAAFADGGYEVGTFVFDRNYLFKDIAEANVLGTSEKLDGAMAWLRGSRSKPFLLFVHNWATHMPYDILHSERKDWLAAKQEVIEGIQADSASALEATREAYREAVERQSETLVASLLDELERLGLREQTVLVFLSDHGESWGERFLDKHEVKGVYHMHGATVYDEVVRVPLILSAPARLDSASVYSQVRSVDVMPTLLDLAGISAPELDGESLLPLVAGREEGDRVAFVAGTDMGALSKLAVRLPPWKLILDVESGQEEAYRLDLDPRERESRPADVPPDLRELLFRELETAERRELTQEEEATVSRRLADLGYL